MTLTLTLALAAGPLAALALTIPHRRRTDARAARLATIRADRAAATLAASYRSADARAARLAAPMGGAR